MNKTKPLEYNLSDQTRDQLMEALSAIRYPAGGYSAYVKSVKDLLPLFGDIKRQVHGFLDDTASLGDRPCAIKLYNLPVSTRVPMPPLNAGDLKHINKPDYVSENLLTLVTTMFGAPYSMHFEGKGLINNLVPSKQSSEGLTGLGAGSDLKFHIENAALRFHSETDCSPRALILTGVRQDRTPPFTKISDARLALDLLSVGDIETLSSPEYKIKLPYRWRPHSSQYRDLTTRDVPLIEMHGDDLIVHAVFYGDMIVEYKSSAAELAAKRFEQALEEVGLNEVVAPGELLAIDNRITLHARTPFAATYDDEGRAFRWAQRIFVTDNIANFSGWESTDDFVYRPKLVA